MNRDDVADQPGLSRSFLGILLAVFLGVIFQAAFSQETITSQLRKAAGNVHANAVIDFERADLSLADGPFPEFAIVVEKVKLSSEDPCWLSPIAEVDELRLPLDVGALLVGRVEITELRLGQVQLQLRTPPDQCKDAHAQSTTPHPPAAPDGTRPNESSPSKVVDDEPLFRPPDSRGPIAQVSVHSLSVQYLPVPFTSFEIDRLSIDRRSESPLSLRTVGELNLGGATLSGDYSSKALFEIDYDHPSVVAKLSGTWREGTYALNLQAEVEKKEIGLEGRIDHLPLSQILPFLKKYNVIKGEYDGRQVWLNLRFKSPDRSRWMEGVPVEVERLSFEGDLGAIEGGGFHIRRWNPLEFSNTEISLRGLQIETLLRLFGQSEMPKSLGALGELNGVLKLEGARRFQLSGEYSGLELIFSNRGERRTQVISLMTGILNYDQGRWNLNVDRVRPFEGLFLGDMHFEGDEDSDQVRGRLHIDEMHLGPEVQNLMSGGGSLGRWAADLEATWKQGQIETLRGQILAQDLMVDGISLNRMRSTLVRNREGGLNLELKGSDLIIQENAPVRNILMPLLPAPTDSASGPLRSSWHSDQLHMLFEVKDNDVLNWKLRPLQFKNWQLRSEGGWNSEGDVKGQVVVRLKEKDSKWKVEGRRDAPIFVEEK